LAAAGRPGPYISGFLGASFARDDTVSGYDSFFNSSFNDRVTFDPGIYVGGTGGYDFGFLRLEGELSYRHAKLDTVTASSGGRYRNVDGDLGTFATMFNVFLDMHNSSRVTPYVGGGIGFATLHLSNTTAFGNAGKLTLYDDSNDTVFASQVGAGVDIAMNSRMSLDLGYRYFITDKSRLDGDFTSSNLRFESHNALVGFRFKF
jgi:outer membrane autotransporter protein